MSNMLSSKISFISLGNKIVSTIYFKGKVVWSAVRSCFGAGFWRGDKPWIGKDAWKGK